MTDLPGGGLDRAAPAVGRRAAVVTGRRCRRPAAHTPRRSKGIRAVRLGRRAPSGWRVEQRTL